MAKIAPLKPEESFARSYADRLILEELTHLDSVIKLGELADKLSSKGLGLAAVRSLLASNTEQFAYHERKWVPAARIEGLGRPFAEVVRVVLDRFGAPMAYDALSREVSRITSKPTDEVEGALERLIDRDDMFLKSTGGKVALTHWAFVGYDETTDRILDLNGVSRGDVESLLKKLGQHDFRAEGAYAAAVKVAAPVSAKVLAAAGWMSVQENADRGVRIFDGREAFAEMIDLEGFVLGADGVIYPEEETKKWITVAVKVADKLAPTVDVDDAAPIEVKVEDISKMIDKIVKSDGSITATRLLEELYEITPANKTFPDDLANVLAALQGDTKVWWVGGDRFRKPGSAPDFIESVPEPFQFVTTEVQDEEGELIDVELTDEGLSSQLRKLIVHPLAMDVLDEEIAPAPKQIQDRQRLVLKSIHRELGTFPLAQLPTGFLDDDPNLQELIFIDPSGRELQVWVNLQARLMYNLIDWWYEQPVESGSVFTITKTAKPNVFEFEWDEQTDPVVFISSQRMEELRNIQAESEGLSTLDVLIKVMSHWPKGADFLTLLAEVNVVRRSTRRLIASLLSSYQCFYQRSGSPVWHFDGKKVDLGFDKSKKKFIKK
ncbi:MAG TPA: hypothetical protein PKA27_04185 [Fimbriimonadaceae bacterium]|nr:hypothetical protein [Fimbriimonadaceae bacterium]